MQDVGDLRLAIYLAALGLAVGLEALVEGPREGAPFWVAASAVAALLAAGWTLSRVSSVDTRNPAQSDAETKQDRGGEPTRSCLGGRLVRYGAAGAAALALALPLGPALAAGEPLAGLLGTAVLWPQALVALFASRVLAEDCDIRFARFWRSPAAAPGGVGLQSTAAALALGAALTLAFYQALWWFAPAGPHGSGTGEIVLAALTGETPVHRAIVFLFFVILGFLFDAALRHGRGRAAFGELRAAARSGIAASRAPRARALRDLIARDFAGLGHLRGIRLVEEACCRGEGDDAGPALAAASFDLFHGSARRFVRALLPILPMLGFFGTVVGLATAMAALPTAAPDAGGVDISASLSGLAIKFQTTLLGILASLAASALLAMLDRAEAEFAAECTLFVVELDGGRHA